MAVTRVRRTRKSTRSRKRPRSYSVRRAGPKYTVRRTAVSNSISRAARSVRSLNPFPRIKFVKHRYVDTITLPAATGAGLGRAYHFRANSTYDPDYTGLGHQPLFRDEMYNMYLEYGVMYSLFKVTHNQTETNQINSRLICTKDPSLDLSNPTTFLEQYGGRIPMIHAQRNLPFVQKIWFSYPRFRKTSRKALMSDDTFRTSAGSNPTEGIYFSIYQAPVDPSVTLAALKVQVEVVYYTYWFNPHDATQS